MIEPINETTFRLKVAEDEIELGDINTAEFKPHARLKRWGEECHLCVKPSGDITEVELEVEQDKVKSKYKVKQNDFELELESEFYTLEPSIVIAKDKDGNDVKFRQNELSGFEFEVILKKKPTTNKIVFDIETEGLKFYYQPALTPEEIADGCVGPDNVVGSYAVYHATRGNMHASQEDAEKYKCGKAFHIYRPKIIDSTGWEVWGGLDIDEGTLRVTIPQDFLDNAIYPVRHAAGLTFGYETLGSLSSNINGYIGASGYATNGENGQATKMTAGLARFKTDSKVTCALYDDSRNLLEATNEVVSDLGVTPPDQFVDFSFPTGPSVTASTVYRLAAFGVGTVAFCRDAAAGKDRLWTAHTYTDGAPNPLPDWNASDYKYSIYCTYTAAAAGNPWWLYAMQRRQ